MPNDFVIEADFKADKVKTGGQEAINIGDKLTRVFTEALKIIDQVGSSLGSLAKLKNIKLSVDGSKTAVKDAQALTKLQADQLKGEKLIQQTKLATARAERESLKLYREKLMLADGQSSAELKLERAKKATLSTERESIKLERDKIQLQQQQLSLQQKQQKASNPAPPRATDNSSGIGTKLRSVGSTLSLGVTAPLTLAGNALFGIGADLDSYKNKLAAATGSTEAAERKLKELRKLAADSAGVFSDFAIDTYAQLKPIEGVLESTIQTTIKAFGRLKLANPELDTRNFGRNLTQLVTQDFEKQDLKELYGAFPRAGEILKEAFALKGSDIETVQKGLKELKKAGKLSMDDFLKGFAEGVEKDKNLSKLTDTVGIRMEKMKERIFVSLEPLGEKVADIIEKSMAALAPYVEKIGQLFNKLSPQVQDFIVYASGIAAAVGPVIYILETVAAILSSEIIVGLAAAGLAIYAFYQAWSNNFGGIQELTGRVVDGLKAYWDEIYSFISSIGGQILNFIRDNWDLIATTIQNASTLIKNITSAMLDAMSWAWSNIVKPIVGIAKWYVSSIVELLLDLSKMAMQIFNGDWNGAWQTFLQIVQTYAKKYSQVQATLIKVTISTLEGIGDWINANAGRIFSYLVSAAFSAIGKVLFFFFTLPYQLVRLIPGIVKAAWDVGKAIVTGIYEGMTNSQQDLQQEIVNTITFDTFLSDLKGKFGDIFDTTNHFEAVDTAVDKMNAAVEKSTETVKKYGGALDDAKEKAKGFKKAIVEQLPSSGTGFTTYRAASGRFGTQDAIANLQTLAQNWNQVSKVPFSVGDISLKGGGAYITGGKKRHDGHQSGTEADVRLMRKDGKDLPVTWQDAAYDRDETRKLIMTARQTLGKDLKVLFNDPVLIKEGLTQYYKGHDNHLHLKGLGGQAKAGADFQQSIESANREQQQKIDQAESDNRLKALMERYATGALGITPEIAKRIAEMENRTTNAGNGSLNEQDIISRYRNANKGVVTTDTPQLLDQTEEFKKARDNQFLDNLTKSLNLSERTAAIDVRRRNLLGEINLKQKDYELSLQEAHDDLTVEASLLQRRNLAFEAANEFTRQQNAQTKGLQDLEIDISVFRKQNADSQFVEQRRLLSAKHEQLDLEHQLADLGDELANFGKNDNLKIQVEYLKDILDLRNQETNAIIASNRAQLELTQRSAISANQIRANLLQHLASQKNINETISDGLIDAFEKAADWLDARLGKIGKIPLLGDLAKFANRSFLTNITNSLMDKFFPGMKESFERLQNPQLAESKDQTKILREIADNTRGNGNGDSAASGGGGVFNQIISIGSRASGKTGSIFSTIGGIGSLLGLGGGGNLGNRASNNNPYIFNAAGNSNNSINQIISNLQRDSIESPVPITGAGSHGAGSGMSGAHELLNLIKGGSGGKGSIEKAIFGKDGFGNNVGTYGVIGTGAGFLGNLIGGRWGGAISGAGQGLALGAQIGSIVPGLGTAVGAGVGAVVGFIAGLFGGNKKKKESEKAYNAAIGDATTQIDDLIRRVGLNRSHRDYMDGQSAVAQANGILAQYQQQMTQLPDKKTRKTAIANASRIQQKIEVLKQAANAQDARNNTATQFTGVFASGVHISPEFMSQYGDFKRRNGILPGTWTGNDNLPSLLAAGEMVLNPRQQSKVIQNAGKNPFVGAGIPNYNPATMKEESPVPSYQTGVSYSSASSSSGSSNNNSSASTTNDSQSFSGTLVIQNPTFEVQAKVDAEGLVITGLTQRVLNVIFMKFKQFKLFGDRTSSN